MFQLILNIENALEPIIENIPRYSYSMLDDFQTIKCMFQLNLMLQLIRCLDYFLLDFGTPYLTQ